MKTRFSLAILLLSLTSQAHAATIKGQVQGQGYKVLTVAPDASSRTVTPAGTGKFTATVTKGSTLHLISDDGRYFGPILAANGKRARTQLSGKSGDIGKIKLNTRGFATSVLAAKTESLFAKKPIAFSPVHGPPGTGNFGLGATTQKSQAFVSAVPRLGEDIDGDGLPGLLDVDDDGDGKLDVVDPVVSLRPEFEGETTSTLRLSLDKPLNANIESLSAEVIDARLKDNLIISFFVRNNTNGAQALTSVDIDCSTLSYCRKGNGTATVRQDHAPVAEGSPWTDYDPNGDGLPNLKVDNGPLAAIMGIHPRASGNELRPGDTILYKLKGSFGERELPVLLPFFFISSPTLASYSSGGSMTGVNYLISADGLGTSSNPIVMQSGSFTMNFWRPQRLPIGDETSAIDIGGLHYGVDIAVEGDNGVYTCLPSEYSSTSLNPASDPHGTQVWVDPDGDGPARPDRTLSMTVNLGSCLSRQGIATSGRKAMIGLVATSMKQDQSSQWIFLRMP